MDLDKIQTFVVPNSEAETDKDQFATVYGTEYKDGSLVNEEVGCSVCQTHQRNVLMITGRDKCYPGFTLEYAGYLAAEHHSHHKSTHICEDGQPEPSLYSDSYGFDHAVLYAAEARCGSLPCSSYPNGKDLLCAVCSR